MTVENILLAALTLVAVAIIAGLHLHGQHNALPKREAERQQTNDEDLFYW